MQTWNKFKSLFSPKQVSQEKQLERKLLEKHNKLAEKLNLWQDGVVCQNLKKWLANQYATYLLDPEKIDDSISFQESSSSAGFVIYFSQLQYSKQEADLFQLYLRNQVLNQKYSTQLADINYKNIQGEILQVDRYYLKPRYKIKQIEEQANNDKPLDQIFGNVLITLSSLDYKAQQLKVTSTVYKDRKYSNHSNFGGLIQQLVS